MDWLKDIIYFNVSIEINDNNKKITFIPKELIHDIYFDNTNHIIPYTNGKCYLVYQDITFRVIEYFENFSNKCSVQLNKQIKIPEIIINVPKIDDINLSIINRIMTNYINSKFSLFIDQN